MSEFSVGSRVVESHPPAGCMPYRGTVLYVADDGWIGIKLDSGRSISVRPSEVEPITEQAPEEFVVIESTPGYMPEDEDPFTGDYRAACAYANELADQLEEDGYTCDRGWASSGNYYAIKCERSDTVAPDLGRLIAVERVES